MNRKVLCAIVAMGLAGCGGNQAPTTPTGKAHLADSGRVVWNAYPPGIVNSLELIVSGTNDGDGCAGHIAGTVDLLESQGHIVRTMNIDQVIPAIIRQTRAYNLHGCCATHEEIQIIVAEISHITYDTVFCP